jgi:cephalosporin-C deacetylase-like acetyl esterase
MAVLLFDYRHFGDSEGQPRNLVNHRRQHRDWLAAIEHAKNIEGIDGERIGLWGSSFSGGHVISVAADHPEVRAIVAQTPMVDMIRALRVDAKFAAASVWHGMWDYTRAILGMSPHYVPIVAPPGQFAALNAPGCDAGYRALVPNNSDWKNQCTARSLLSSLSFRPSRKAALVTCPAMFAVAEQDQVIRPRVIHQVAGKMAKAESFSYPVDHFEIYQGQVLKEISRA